MTINIVIEQILSMNILAFIGYFAFKSKILSKQAISELTNFLLKVVGYFIIVNAIISALTIETQHQFFNAFYIALILNIIYALVVTLCFKKKRPVISFGTVFSNASFMGIPLIFALIGTEGILYLIPFLIIQIIGQWTYGVWQMDKNYQTNFTNTAKIILLNPAMLGLFTGLAIYFLRIPLPNFLLISIKSVANLNTPLAMIILGTFIAEVKLEDFADIYHIFLACLFRLVILPAVTILYFFFFKVNNLTLITTFIISACAPIPISTAMFSLRYQQNVKFASAIITVSTIISIVSIPLTLYLASLLHII